MSKLCLDMGKLRKTIKLIKKSSSYLKQFLSLLSIPHPLRDLVVAFIVNDLEGAVMSSYVLIPCF